MKPQGPAGGFDRLLQMSMGGGPVDPQWLELQRRLAGAAAAGAGGVLGGHLPGVYPPANITNDLIQREREKIERFGKGTLLCVDRCPHSFVHRRSTMCSNPSN